MPRGGAFGKRERRAASVRDLGPAGRRSEWIPRVTPSSRPGSSLRSGCGDPASVLQEYRLVRSDSVARRDVSVGSPRRVLRGVRVAPVWPRAVRRPGSRHARARARLRPIRASARRRSCPGSASSRRGSGTDGYGRLRVARGAAGPTGRWARATRQVARGVVGHARGAEGFDRRLGGAFGRRAAVVEHPGWGLLTGARPSARRVALSASVR